MNRILSWCSVAALVFVPACGDSKAGGPAGSGSVSGSGSGSASKPAGNSQNPVKKKQGTKRVRVRPVRLDMVMVKALWGMDPSAPKVDNPATPEKVALGRMLFHEKHLSKNGDISCASCHDLMNYGQDSKPISPGTGGKMGERNTPTVWNAFRQYRQFWDYRANTVEDQPSEHGLGDAAEVVAKIKEKPELVKAFDAAFEGDELVTAENFGLAIGAFQRTLVTKSRFDKFLDGDSKALTNEEKIGLKTFMTVGCQTCHMSRLVGANMPQKLGVFSPYPTKDTGRHKVTGNEAEKFFFKVPSLLNVEKTAPYTHDGKVATLEAVVKLMAEIQLAKKITKEQVTSIVAFLKTLTGELPKEIISPK